jgi:hypothetical protein
MGRATISKDISNVDHYQIIECCVQAISATLDLSEYTSLAVL